MHSEIYKRIGNGMKLNIEHEKVSLRQLHSEYKSGEINLTPPYQRGFVWSQEMKDKLIDSLKSGLPIHDIVFARFDGREHGFREVIDGKHRLLSIFECLNSIAHNKNAISVDFRLKPINITSVINPTQDQILEVYDRLNYGGIQHGEKSK